MHALIDAAFARGRTVLLVFGVLLIAGAAAYTSIPKEAEPDIQIPIIYVSMTHDGISPEDAERLLVRPMEKELRSIDGVKEVRSVAAEGYGAVTLEFVAGFDPAKALANVREKVDIAKSQLPADTDEPRVNEVNVALFPVVTLVLSGDLPERTLVAIARKLKDDIEGLRGVLEVDIGGNRDDVMEIIVDPVVLETYGISLEALFALIDRNNRLVAAGALEGKRGRMVIKVPGVIEKVEDVLNMPIKVKDATVVRFRDVAQVRRTFKDPDGFARVDAKPALTLEIKKRTGANIIETIAEVRALVAARQAAWPATLRTKFMQDRSQDIRELLGDLQNNVLSAIILVMVVVVAALGLRSGILVGLAIPGSFLTGILALYALGLTMNIVVLFSLILVVGMLVDGAIVVSELADRKLAEGLDRKDAYASAAKRMFWPVTASAATTLTVFFPLLFWPDLVGEFMKFLPITVIATLLASLLMALVFLPVLGALIGPRGGRAPDPRLVAAESGDLTTIGGFTGRYLGVLGALVKRPGRTLLAAFVFLIGAYAAYGTLGRGVEFFPKVEPKFAQVQIRARGDLSVSEKDGIVREVERRIARLGGVRTVYARTIGVSTGSRDIGADVVGTITLEFTDWQTRRKAAQILEDVRRRTASVPGVLVEIREQERGPGQGKPIQILVSSREVAALAPTVARLRKALSGIDGLVDIEDTRSLPGVEWRLEIDREKAARYGADILLLGRIVQMVTNGIKVAEYRPDDADNEIDIRIRFPHQMRNLDQLVDLRVPTGNGLVPIRNFVTFVPAAKTGKLNRTDGLRVLTVSAGVRDGVLVAERLEAIKAAFAKVERPEAVEVRFKGQDEDQRRAGAFLTTAFLVAVFFMLLILVTQFNSLYQAGLVLSAIIFSTAGVLLGLLIADEPFGIVMGGIGVIALAGIVVNNNIVLIDTYNDLKKRGLAPQEAVLRTAAQRLRPVILTSVTTVLGLMPMVLALNLDIVAREITVGAPSTQWWTQLSAAIAGGLSFATVLTLILTPCLLILGERLMARFGRLKLRWPARRRRLGVAAR